MNKETKTALIQQLQITPESSEELILKPGDAILEFFDIQIRSFYAVSTGDWRCPRQLDDSQIHLPFGANGLVVLHNETDILVKHLKRRPGYSHGMIQLMLGGELVAVPNRNQEKYLRMNNARMFYLKKDAGEDQISEIDIAWHFLSKRDIL